MFQMKVGRVFLELLALCLDLACAFYFFNFAINIPCFISAFVALHIMPIPHNQTTMPYPSYLLIRIDKSFHMANNICIILNINKNPKFL
jgi:hypothetical protein